MFVAVAGGVIVGTVTLGRPGTRFANMARAGGAEVRMLAVDEAARGQGIASLLMDACEGLARDEGFAALVLSTAVSRRWGRGCGSASARRSRRCRR